MEQCFWKRKRRRRHQCCQISFAKSPPRLLAAAILIHPPPTHPKRTPARLPAPGLLGILMAQAHGRKGERGRRSEQSLNKHCPLILLPSFLPSFLPSLRALPSPPSPSSRSALAYKSPTHSRRSHHPFLALTYRALLNDNRNPRKETFSLPKQFVS